MKIIKSGFEFKMKYTFNERKNRSEYILNKYQNKVPIIVERGDNTVNDLDNSNLILDKNITIGKLLYIIRNKIHVDQYDSIYLFIEKGYIPNTNDNIGKIYDKHVDADGFLYITYCREQTFG